MIHNNAPTHFLSDSLDFFRFSVKFLPLPRKSEEIFEKTRFWAYNANHWKEFETIAECMS